MRERFTLDEDAILRAGSALLGLILLASSAVSFELAREHMAALGVICGSDQAPHCGWCYASVGFFMTGVSTLIAAARRAPATQRA